MAKVTNNINCVLQDNLDLEYLNCLIILMKYILLIIIFLCQYRQHVLVHVNKFLCSGNNIQLNLFQN